MNLPAKRVYCRKCNGMASVRRDIDGENTTVVCNGCNTTSYALDRVGWKCVGG